MKVNAKQFHVASLVSIASPSPPATVKLQIANEGNFISIFISKPHQQLSGSESVTKSTVPHSVSSAKLKVINETN